MTCREEMISGQASIHVLLQEAGDAGLAISEVIEKTGYPGPRCRRHLSALRVAGLIVKQGKGTAARYVDIEYNDSHPHVTKANELLLLLPSTPEQLIPKDKGKIKSLIINALAWLDNQGIATYDPEENLWKLCSSSRNPDESFGMSG